MLRTDGRKHRQSARLETAKQQQDQGKTSESRRPDRRPTWSDKGPWTTHIGRKKYTRSQHTTKGSKLALKPVCNSSELSQEANIRQSKLALKPVCNSSELSHWIPFALHQQANLEASPLPKRLPRICHSGGSADRVFHYKPFILGYPYFWKHPFCGRKKITCWKFHRGRHLQGLREYQQQQHLLDSQQWTRESKFCVILAIFPPIISNQSRFLLKYFILVRHWPAPEQSFTIVFYRFFNVFSLGFGRNREMKETMWLNWQLLFELSMNLIARDWVWWWKRCSVTTWNGFGRFDRSIQ